MSKPALHLHMYGRPLIDTPATFSAPPDPTISSRAWLIETRNEAGWQVGNVTVVVHHSYPRCEDPEGEGTTNAYVFESTAELSASVAAGVWLREHGYHRVETPRTFPSAIVHRFVITGDGVPHPLNATVNPKGWYGFATRHLAEDAIVTLKVLYPETAWAIAAEIPRKVADQANGMPWGGHDPEAAVGYGLAAWAGHPSCYLTGVYVLAELELAGIAPLAATHAQIQSAVKAAERKHPRLA